MGRPRGSRDPGEARLEGDSLVAVPGWAPGLADGLDGARLGVTAAWMVEVVAGEVGSGHRASCGVSREGSRWAEVTFASNLAFSPHPAAPTSVPPWSCLLGKLGTLSPCSRELH